MSFEARCLLLRRGGLNMVASGLVPGLPQGGPAGGLWRRPKVITSFSITDPEHAEKSSAEPDILLWHGGGSSQVILPDAARVAQLPGRFPVVLAGNRAAEEECANILAASEHPVFRAPNVMPEMNRRVTEPVQQVIRQVFLERIVMAKGLSKTKALLDGILMPTPSAVLDGLTLLSRGTRKKSGLGDLVAVDLGGATTDIYSIADGFPKAPDTVLRGLMEPR